MALWKNVSEKKKSASLVLLLLILLTLVASIPFLQGFFAGVILTSLFFPLFIFLKKRFKLSSALSAILVLLFSTFIILAPLLAITYWLVGQSVSFLQQPELLANYGRIFEQASEFIGFSLNGDPTSLQQSLLQELQRQLPTLTHALINLGIMYFVFYYSLLYADRIRTFLFSISPFSPKHTKRFLSEFSAVTNATLIATGIIALLMGLMLSIGFIVLGIPFAFFFGVLSFVLSFLPILGAALIWGLGAVYYFAIGDLYHAVGLIVLGIVMTISEQTARILLQEYVGKLHPLISFVGAFVGLSFFGVSGLVIGPFLFSFLFLFAKAYNEEYAASRKAAD